MPPSLQCIQNNYNNKSLDSFTPIQHIKTISQNNSNQHDFYQNIIPSKILREFCNINEIIIKAANPVQEIQIYTMTNGNKENTDFSKHSEHFLKVISTEGDFLYIITPSSNEFTVYVKPAFLRTIHLNHIICTFKKEDCIQKRIEDLKDLCSDEYHLTVIDNGHTITPCTTDGITVIQSPNYGGTAGFTRGILESLKTDCTHVLLNDDDALIDQETIFRTISLLKILSPEYYERVISGIILDQNNPEIVFEAGGIIDRGTLRYLSSGIDISTIEGIDSLFRNYRIDYSAWTFSCIPLDSFRKNGLPLPLTIWFDDVEYGLRTHMKVITVPGISAIHPRHDYATRRRYYHGRNLMIALSTSDRLDSKAVNDIFEKISVEIATYRYQFADEMLKGIADYLKGPDYVFSNMKEGLRPEPNLKTGPLSELRNKLEPTDPPAARSYRKRLLSLNGLFLRPFGDIESAEFDMDTSHFYHIRTVLYHIDGKTGFIAERNTARTLSLTFRTVWLKLKTKMMIKKLKRTYREALPRYTSIEYWTNLLCKEEEK